jgi:hypothetical protein
MGSLGSLQCIKIHFREFLYDFRRRRNKLLAVLAARLPACSVFLHVFREYLLFVAGKGSGFFGAEIVVHHYSAAFYTEPFRLPRFMVNREGLVPYVAYPCAYFNVMLKVKLIHEIVIRMGHNQGPGFMGKLHAGIEDLEERIPGKFKPAGRDRIVDVPKDIHIPKTGSHRYFKHTNNIIQSLKKYNTAGQKTQFLIPGAQIQG